MHCKVHAGMRQALNIRLARHDQRRRTVGAHPIIHGTAAAHVDTFQHVFNLSFLALARHMKID